MDDVSASAPEPGAHSLLTRRTRARVTEEQLLGEHGFTALAGLSGRLDLAQPPAAALRRMVQLCEHWALGLAPDLTLDAFADKVARLESNAGLQDFRANMYIEQPIEPTAPSTVDDVAARIAANRAAAVARKREREQARLAMGSTAS